MIKAGVSIIICCYNSSFTIEETLKYIARQNLCDVPCEIVLVDNASSDNTAEIAQLVWQKTGNDQIKFKLYYEPLHGLIFARKKGALEATYEYLIFCDDDNWLDESYVANTFSLFNKYPGVAILGGLGSPEFENPFSKPIWFDSLYHGYAIGPQAEKEGFVNGVYGAGMCIRRSVLNQIVKSQSIFLSGRKRRNLSSGEDGEICLLVRIAGYRIWYSPQLTFKHFLTNNRLTWNYLKKLHTGLSGCNLIISLYEKALNTDNIYLSNFYWLKKGLYYWGIYLKYWPKQYLSYRKTEGTIDEIYHITWKNIALSYFKYNFKTVSMYSQIIKMKNNVQLS